LLGATALAAAASPPSFLALKWTTPGAELEVLSRQSEQCLDYTVAEKPLIKAGEALFNTPTLLGGQAAKAGLSCASCHNNGHDNPHFRLAGLSDAPGTADVSNSFFSPARGNGKFDPVRIPDLAMPGKVPRDPNTNALKPFIRNLIVDEFSGQEPSAATLDALAAFVRAIKTCPSGGEPPLTLQKQLALLDAAMGGADLMTKQRDFQAARLLLASARHQLGLINERYSGQRLKPQRQKLMALSTKFRKAIESSDTTFADAQFMAFAAYANAELWPELQRTERYSLYNPALLSKQFKP
jgi:hypothetical protein